jgi:carboxymethylenebutenolidase
MTSTRTDTINGPDGSFDAHVVTPDAGTGPGLVIIQEIFGVNTYIKSVCERVAQMGYVALAPDMFWRQEPGFTVEPDQGEAGMNSAFEKMGAFDFSTVAPDLGAALDHLNGLAETTGTGGLMGFCFGGTLTFLGAAQLEPSCAISYYGSGVAGNLDQAGNVSCPILFHFGDSDPYLPNEDADAVIAAFADVASAEVRVAAGAGHAFDNNTNPMFANPEAAAPAWEATAAFLSTHLPVG